jgi:hypothetical protein
MRSHHAVVLLRALIVSFVFAPACGTGDVPRAIIASTNEWSVTAVGALDARDQEITFESHRRGQLYAAGYLHFDSDSFNTEFPERRWVAPNVLHLFADYGQPQYDIVLRNAASMAIKWIRIGSQDVFLAFDVPPGAEVRLSGRWQTYGFSIQGEFADGRSLPKAEAFREEPARVDIRVDNENASIQFGK